MKTTHRTKLIAFLTIIAMLVVMFPSTAFASTSVSAPTKVTTTRKAYNEVQIKWNKVSGADGYAVYKATSENGTYSLIKRIDSGKTVSYTWNKTVPGKTYYFKVKAYKKVNGKRVYGKYSTPVKFKAYIAKPTIYQAHCEHIDFQQVYWSKVSGATGYEIFRSTSPDGTYKKIATLNASKIRYGACAEVDRKAHNWTASGKSIEAGKAYYYKVRAYRTINGKKVYSNFSDYSVGFIAVSAKQPWTKITYLEGEGEKVLELVNAERKKQGYPELEWDEELYEYAKVRVQNCCRVYYRDGFLSHNAVDKNYFTGLDELGIYNGAAENAAANFYRGQDVFVGWMNSKGHKALFLDYYDHDDPSNSAACSIGIDKNGMAFGIFITKYDRWFVKSFEYFE